MNEYNKIVKSLPQHALSNGEIDYIMKDVKSYKGTYAINEPRPKLRDNQYVILNNYPIESDGQHWFALAKHDNKHIYLYDSFARKTENFIDEKYLKHFKNIKSSKDNVEQKILESNCGARCIAFIKCCIKYSIKEVVAVI
jgi:hypothetical protein